MRFGKKSAKVLPLIAAVFLSFSFMLFCRHSILFHQPFGNMLSFFRHGKTCKAGFTKGHGHKAPDSSHSVNHIIQNSRPTTFLL